MLKIHCLQHVPYETPGSIAEWAAERGHSLSYTRFFLDEPLPPVDQIDWLVVMGGPMGVYEEQEFPWLKAEKAFIKKAIEAGKTAVGVCLGSQLLAEALGARVYKHNQKEIGWFPVYMTDGGPGNPLFKGMEPSFTVFHWHGDTFEIPAGASRILYSEACANQAFVFENRIVGLQFHLEMRLQAIRDIMENNRHELVEAPFIQREEQLLDGKHIEKNINRMNLLLDRLFEQRQSGAAK